MYFVRHGQTDWNRPPKRCQGWTEVGLNKEGRAQARRLADRLKGKGICRIYSSHLLRARQTAQIVSKRLKVPVMIERRLAEAKRGEWEGISFAAIRKRDPALWQKWQKDPQRFRFPGGESLTQLKRRAVAAMKHIRNTHPQENVLVISHGGTIRALFCHFQKKSLGAFHKMRVSNQSVRIMQFRGKRDNG